MDGLSSLLKAILPCFPLGTTERAIQLPTGTPTSSRITEKVPVPSDYFIEWQEEKVPVPVQPSPYGGKKARMSREEAAESIVSAMLDADEIGPSLNATIQSIVHQAGGWSEWLAAKILAALEAVLKADKSLNAAMKEAYDKACEAFQKVEGFAVDHPVFCTLIALGILVVLVPYVVECLGFCAGFGELGPIEGKLAPSYLPRESVAMNQKGSSTLTLLLTTGSWAALWQSRYAGMVPKGSLFSFFQRLGMTWKRL